MQVMRSVICFRTTTRTNKEHTKVSSPLQFNGYLYPLATHTHCTHTLSNEHIGFDLGVSGACGYYVNDARMHTVHTVYIIIP